MLTTSGDNTFTTSAVVDTTAPVISGITATSLTEAGATITWTTDEASDSQVDYGLTTSYGSSTTLDAAMTTSHSVPITGLTASTLYHYRVKSRNAVSLLTTSTDNTFTTTGLPQALLTGLLAYWKLDETTGSRVDSVASVALVPGGAITAATGKFNGCPHFDGTAGAYLQGPNTTFAEMGAGVDYTIAAWVQVEDKTTDRTFLSKAGTGTGGTEYDEYVLNYDHTSTPHQLSYTVQATNASYYTVWAADLGDPAANTWYLVVVWHDITASTINIQVNNGAVNTLAITQPLGVAQRALPPWMLWRVFSQFLEWPRR